MSFIKSLFGIGTPTPATPQPKTKPTAHATEPAGPLTETQKNLVQESWAKVVPIADPAAELFYGKLFELDPEIKPLFAKSDMKDQGKKLMTMIGVAVKGLDSLDQIVPAVQALGKGHVAYGVKAEHYDTVGAALLDTLEKGLGDDFTPDTKEAWTITYTTLATVMKDAAYG